MSGTSGYNYYLRNNKIATKMEENEYDKLRSLILEACDVPLNLFHDSHAGNKHCYFMFEYKTCNFLFIDPGYEAFTGYLPQEHQQYGLDFWFSKVHPQDRRMLGDRILESMKIRKKAIDIRQPDSHILNYRFKKGTGEWIWMQHTVYNISYDQSGKVDKLLHKLRELEVLVIPNEPLVLLGNISKKVTESLNSLTPKEKQTLKLIGEGLSSKMIAGKMKISINTVETHRRHLLEKLGARNSMELVKKAFTLFWN